MKIAISCLYFTNITGSERYVFDLSKELMKRGHEVTIHASEIGGIMFDQVDDRIRLSPRQRLKEKPDILLAQHHTWSRQIVEDNPDVPVVYTMHSEKLQDEFPVFRADNIKKYIAVRQPIADFAMAEFGIPSDLIEVVPNGVDLTEFYPDDNEPKVICFIPGSVTGLRTPFMEKLIKNYPDEQLVFMGIGVEQLPDAPNVRKEQPHWHIASAYRQSKWAAGLFSGRTEREAWACGIPFKSFDWDGTSLPSVKPDNFEEEYGLESVVSKLESIYTECINK